MLRLNDRNKKQCVLSIQRQLMGRKVAFRLGWRGFLFLCFNLIRFDRGDLKLLRIYLPLLSGINLTERDIQALLFPKKDRVLLTYFDVFIL